MTTELEASSMKSGSKCGSSLHMVAGDYGEEEVPKLYKAAL